MLIREVTKKVILCSGAVRELEPRVEKVLI